jgi:hypothetical protein
MQKKLKLNTDFSKVPHCHILNIHFVFSNNFYLIVCLLFWKERPGLVPTPHRLTKSFTPRIDTTSQTSAFKTNTNN